MRRRLLAGLVVIGALVLAAASPADRTGKPAQTDQGGGFDFTGQAPGTPLEVYADNGLELSQDAKTVIARGNAKAIRGRVTVTGDVLTAHYRDRQPAPGQAAVNKDAKSPGDLGGNSEVWRVEADGHVTIATPTQIAYGDHADYNIDDAVVVLTGRNLRLVTPSDVVTAKDSLEYWERRDQAVARGQAVAVRGEKRVQGDVLVADFAKNAQGQMAIQRAHAYNHVILTTPREIVTGDRADDNIETGIVTVTGSVKITREENQLDGGYAVVNLNTGISRIFPAPPGGGAEQRVKGLLVPQKKPTDAGPAAVPVDSGNASVKAR
jgi:lipopolysaccharide export system protein LptA